MRNLNNYFSTRKFDENNWETYPIVLRWMDIGHMQNAIGILDSKVDYLLKHSRSKLNEWFSSDSSLTQITAERYILDYLRLLNINLHESFTGGGVDAFLDMNKKHIGLEVTTINSATPEWILNERLLMFLDKNKYDKHDGIEISYSLDDISNINYSYQVIRQIGEKILHGEYGSIGNISIKKIKKSGAFISWNQIAKPYNLFGFLEKRILQILNDKSTQLSSLDSNILLIGVNQLPHHEYAQCLIREIREPKRFEEEVKHIDSMIKNILPSNVIGVVFFTYTLDSVSPMYPLRIFWRDIDNQINICL